MTRVLIKTIVAGSLSAKLIWSPGAAAAMAWRNEPGPSSCTVKTVRTLCRPLGVMAGAVKDWSVAAFAAGGILGDTKPALADTAPRQSAAAVEHWVNEKSFLIESMV
jgi:hypothetical protein